MSPQLWGSYTKSGAENLLRSLARTATSGMKLTRTGTMSLSIIAAFAAVYLFWGSTYLAIRFAIETLPPFFMAALRYSTAGIILYTWAHRTGAPHPERRHWRTAFVTGGLLLLGGNGVVVWAEQFVSSGLAALLVATVPLWLVVIGAIAGRQTPSRSVSAGVAVGLGGVLLLVGPENIAGRQAASLAGAAAVVFAAFSWALGTHFSRTASQPSSQIMATGITMMAGGLLLAAFGALNGELARFDASSVSAKSWLALAYLVIFGSIVGFSAYMWLVRVTTPAKASSNFYVNPVVAVILGWFLAGETLTQRTVLAAIVIVSAVALIVSQKGGQSKNQLSEERSPASSPGVSPSMSC